MVKDIMMRKTTLALGTVLVLGLTAASTASQAGWASRVSGEKPVIPTERLIHTAPIGENYKFPTKADRVQGIPPYQASVDSLYGAPTPPAITSPVADPAYFDRALGSKLYR